MAVRKGSRLDAGGRSATAVDGPFRVTFAGPEGDDVEVPQPQLIFSRPVRALGQKRDEPRLEARFTPEVPGRWEWVGTSAARFVADGPFAQATTYSLELPAGLRSLDGEPLAQGARVTFSTLRPTLSSVYPGPGGSELPLTESLQLQFSQVIPRAALEAGLSVVDRAGQPLPFVLERNGDTWNQSVQIKPRGAWPEGERLTVRLAAGIAGEEGDLRMKARELTFDTMSPLHVTSIECSRGDDGRCSPWSYVQVSLSGDMRPSDLMPLLKITPAVKLKSPDRRDDDPTTYHTFYGEFEPGIKYTIAVSPSTKTPRQLRHRKRGQELEELRPLKRGAAEELVFAPPDTGVHFSFSGTYVEPSAEEVGARAEETRKAVAGGVALDRALVMRIEGEQRSEAAKATPWWELPGIKTVALPVRASLKDPPGWRGLDGVVPARTGPVLFGARWDGWAGPEQSTQVLQRSDLALYARTSGEGTLAWVTSLHTGEPIEGAAVEARDAAGKSVTALTGKDGVATLATAGMGAAGPRPEGHRRSGHSPWMVLFVQRGDDWIYRRVQAPSRAPMLGTMFTDRGLYRPGEEASIKGIVRQPTSRGISPVDGKQVTLEIRDPDGRTTRTTEALGAWGSFSHQFIPSEDAPLGRYDVVAEVEGERVASQSFRVKEFRPSSFWVESALDRKTYTRGDAIECRGRGSYLYGGSLQGSTATAYFSRQHTTFQIPGLKGYTVGQSASGSLTPIAGGERGGTLDGSGAATFRAILDNADQEGPELVTCDVTVTDPGMDRVGSSTTALVHPGDAYVALEDVRWQRLTPGQTIKPKVLLVTPEGVRRSRPARLELWQHLRDPKKTWATLPPTVVSSCELTTQADPVGCSLAAPRGPNDEVHHFVIKASAKDPQGHAVWSTAHLYPGKPPRPKPTPRWKPKAKPRPEAKLEADRESYAGGEVARLKATSPFAEGQALLTVEREGVIEHRVEHVTREPVTFDVKIDEESAPFVDAVATFIAPFADHTSYRRMMAASTRLKSGWAQHRLEVAVRPAKSQATPGEEMDVDVDVRMGDGQPAQAEVTLYAADEATLLLADYKLPDPLDHFFDNRQHNVASSSTRDDLGSLFDWKAELRAFGLGSIGHGGGTGTGQGFGSGHGRLAGSHRTRAPSVRMGATSAERARKNFRQGAFFLPGLTTDGAGHVRAHVRLPDSLTTYRVMAFAATKAADFGAAQTPVMTSMPLQIRPVLPRVIRAGDRFSVGAMAANNGPATLEASVTFAVEGIELRGPATQRVSLGPGASRRLTFEVEATRAGKGKLIAEIQGGDGLTDAAELPLDIEAPLVLEAAALYGTASGRVDEQLGDLSAVRPDVGSLELTLSASPLAGLAAGLEQLVEYPYGCTEQTTSRLVPLLSLRDLARSLSVALPPDVDDAAREAVRRLQGNQQKDGGFGLWPGSHGSSPWMSAYATWGLEEARRHRVPLDSSALARARAHLLSGLAGWDDGPQERAAAPFALDVLAGGITPVGEAGDAGEATDRADVQSLRIIADQMFKGRAAMPLFSRALLLHAMGRLSADPADTQALAAELAAGLHIDGPAARFVGGDAAYSELLDSSVRTSALVLRALLAVSPGHPLVTPLAIGLVADRKGGTWRTTQEAAWALLALDDYRRQQGEALAVDGRVVLGEATLLQRAFGAAQGGIAPDARLTIPMARIVGSSGQPLSFIGEGAGALHYQARLRFSPRDLPADDVASGFEIHRRYYLIPPRLDADVIRSEGWKQDTGEFAEGAMILSEIDVVTASTRRFVVIDDPLPGGLESVDLELQGGPRWLRRYGRERSTRTERRDDRVLFFADELSPGTHRFAHLARATAKGTFVLPPARVEEMYTPETFGRTAARVISVK
jgi:alpha-2-macroglobulin